MLLQRVGEKFMEWVDNRSPLSLDTILSFASFYWYTKSFGRAMWAYHDMLPVLSGEFPAPPSLTKPFGFSSFAKEVSAFPRAWAEHLFPNLVLHRDHDVVSDSVRRLAPCVPARMLTRRLRGRAGILQPWRNRSCFCRMLRTLWH